MLSRSSSDASTSRIQGFYTSPTASPSQASDPSVSGHPSSTVGTASEHAGLTVGSGHLLYDPVRDNLAAFEKDPSRIEPLRMEFQKLVDELSASAEKHGCAKAKNFQDDLNLLHRRVFYPDNVSPEHKLKDKTREQFFWMGLTDLRKLCGHLQNDAIKPDKRREVMDNLADRMTVCGEGIGSYLSDAVEELELGSQGVTGKVKLQQKSLFLDTISRLAQRLHKDACPNRGNYADWDAHYINAYRNKLGEIYGIEPKADLTTNFLLEEKFVTDEQLELCRLHLELAMTPVAIAEHLAEECISQAKEKLQNFSEKPENLDSYLKSLRKQYGDFAQDALIATDPGKPPEVRDNSTLLCLEMLKTVDDKSIFPQASLQNHSEFSNIAADEVSENIHAPGVMKWSKEEKIEIENPKGKDLEPRIIRNSTSLTLHCLGNKTWLKNRDNESGEQIRSLITIEDLPHFDKSEKFLAQCPKQHRVRVLLELLRNSPKEDIDSFLAREFPTGFIQLRESLFSQKHDPWDAEDAPPRNQTEAEDLLIALAENLRVDDQNSLLRWKHIDSFLKSVRSEKYDLHAVFRKALLQGKTAAVKLMMDFMSSNQLLKTQDASGKTLLHIAAELGSKDTVEALLNHDRSMLEATDNKGNTALHWSCRSTSDSDPNAKLKTLKYLLGQGASIMARLKSDDESDGHNIMHIAAESDNVHAIEFLASLPEAKKLLSTRNAKWRYPLHTAAQHCKKPETITALVAVGANVANDDGFSWDALHYAMQSKNLPALHGLLENGARLDKNSSTGKNIMHYAAEQGFSECLAILAEFWCKQHPNADWPRDESGATPLHAALRSGHLNSAHAILNALGDDKDRKKYLLSQTTSIGNSLLHLALGNPSVQNASRPLLSFLNMQREQGLFDADLVNRPNRLGETPLHQWANLGNQRDDELQLLNTLKQNWQADFELRDQEGRTPLLIAVRKNLPSRVAMLCLAGADPATERNARFRPSRNALHAAVKRGFTEVVEALLGDPSKYSAFIDTYKDGLTPLMRAVKLGHTEIVNLLLQRGADPTKQDQLPYSRRTVLQRAKGYLRRSSTEIVRLIDDARTRWQARRTESPGSDTPRAQ